MGSRQTTGTVAAAAACLIMTACVGPDGNGTSGNGPGASGTAAPTGEATPGPRTGQTAPEQTTSRLPSPGGPTPRRPEHTQPLVLAMHATRAPIDVPVAAARRVVAGSADTWADLTGAERADADLPLRVVAAPGTPVPARLQVDSARAAVGAVTRDRDTLAVVPAAAVGPRVRSVHVSGVDPLRLPDRYPLRVGAADPPGPVVTMTVTGDIMLGRRVERVASGSTHPAPALEPMQDRLAAADITVGNLENTLSRAGAPRQGSDSFAAPPRVVRGLRRAGFDVLGLANNHAGDFGDRALVQTVRRLQDRGIETFGAGADPEEAWEPVVVERSGVRFGFLGFNAIGETPAVAPGQPGAVQVSMPPRTGPLDRGELRRFLRAIRRLDRDVDVVVAMPHWGTQYTNRPEPVQRRVARRLVTAGADLVVGGHPHWVQGTEMVGGTLVNHSLGNFVFDMDFMTETMRGLLLEVTYWGDELKGADFVPYRLDDRFAPRVVPHRRGLDTLLLMWETSGPAFRP